MIDASDLSVFSKLSGSQIDRLAAAFQSAKSESEAKAREIAGEDFTDADIDRIVRSFHGFLSGATEADLRRLANSSSLGADKTSIVRAVIDTMRYGSDAERPRPDAANAGPAAPPCGIEGQLRDYEQSDPDSESRDLLALFGLEPEETPPPTIKGILAGCTGDMDSLALVKAARGG